MSASLARLRKRAAELEQKKQFDRALEVYVQILDEGGKDLDDEDVPLFNRVGDMLMRKGSVTEALGYYERAVDMYAERGYLNNAIALCSKILRQSPGRAAVYYKLARISAKKGFKSDARKNFLEYADRMQKLGMADEAFRALKEFASLYPDQDDVRLILAELLSKENRKGEALEQLQSLYAKLQSEGRAAEARATIDRMRAIDPSVTPKEGTATQTPAAGDLVFLDLNEQELPQATPTQRQRVQPSSARAPINSPVPALEGLSITFFPDETDAPHPEGFESTAVEPEPVDTAPVARSLTPAASELVVEPEPTTASELEAEPLVPFDMIDEKPAPLERIEHVVEDLLPDREAVLTEAEVRSRTPLTGFEFGDLELEDEPRDQPPREHDLQLSGDLPATPEDVPALESDAAGEDARAAAEEAAELAADIAAREAVQQPLPPEWQPPPRPAVPDVEPPVEPAAPAIDSVLGGRQEPEPAESIPDDFLSMPPRFGAATELVEDHAFPPLAGLDDSASGIAEPPATEPQPAPEAKAPTPRATISIGSAESHLRSRLELDPENWDLRRQLGEALLDTGDREGGLYELELAMVGFELRGYTDRAQELVDVILNVIPGSISHHQKRVEYAVRSRDRGRLTYSYLELADALFRTGAADKAVAVYGRVLELDRDNERAEFALATLAPSELVRLRGVPARPDRWTDELATLGDRPPADSSSPDSDAPVPDEGANGAATVDQGTAPAAGSERARFRSLELPVPDWGEGVPRGGAVPAPEAAAAATQEPTPIDQDDIEPDEATAVYPSPDNDVDSLSESAAASGFEPPVTDSDSPVPSEPTPRSTTRVVAETRSPTPPSAPVPRTDTPLSVPTPRSPTPLSVPTPRSPTPRTGPLHRDTAPISAAPIESQEPFAVSSPISETLGDSESDFIDLGEWLRNTEPVRSTRMQVEDPKPTGDEQADFEEMLRRFKRGVAENVEAEDYEAHYDLGVAFKEMGLIDEAIAQFQKALRGPTQRVRSYEALGQCFVEKQQYPIAAALLQRATEVPGSDDQQLVGVLYLLGFATEHLGRPAEALPYYLRVFAVDIEFRDVAERVDALGKLTK